MDGFEYFKVACGRDPQPYHVGKNGKYQCPCCRYFTLELCNQYDICPVCFWEDDGAVNDEDFGGPNHMTLGEGREAYGRLGVCKDRMKEHVRLPLLEEIDFSKI